MDVLELDSLKLLLEEEQEGLVLTETQLIAKRAFHRLLSDQRQRVRA